MATTFNITADSIPVLDEWGWGDYWGVQEWIQWYDLVKKKHSKVYADTLFKIYWNKQDTFASPYNWAKYDTDFREFLKRENLLSSVSNVVADVVAGAGAIISGAGRGAENVGEATEDLGEGVKYATTTIKWLIPVVIIVIVGIALLSFKKKAL